MRMLLGSSTLTAIILQYGAGPLLIGVLAAIPYGVRMVQLWTPQLIARHGAHSIAFRAAWLERGSWLAIGALAALRPPGAPGWLLAAFACAMIGFSVYDTAITAAHTEVMGVGERARLGAWRARAGGLAGFAVGLLSGLLINIAERHGVGALSIRLGIVAAGLGLSVVALRELRHCREQVRRYWTESPGPLLHPDAGWRARLTQAVIAPLHPVLRPAANERRLLSFALAWGLALGLLFRHVEAFLLSHMGVTLGEVNGLNGLLVGGAVLGATGWGFMVERFGAKPVLGIAAGILALDPLLLVLGAVVHPSFFALSYLAYGCGAGGWAIALPAALVRSDHPGPSRLRTFALFQAISGIGAGVGPLLGGALLELMAPLAALGPLRAHLVLFLLAGVLRGWAVRGVVRVSPDPQVGTSYAARAVGRLLRRRLRRVAGAWVGGGPLPVPDTLSAR